LNSSLKRRYGTALGIAAAVIAADLITKRFASDNFVDGRVEVVPGFLEFTYTENPGAAFSLFPNAGPWIGVIAIAIAAFILGSLRVPRPRMEVIALGLVLGGALGNVIDRIARGEGFLDGKVIDWIILWWIPTFNIADASVTIAVALLLIYAWRTR
jgi:signal peptidase II